jgi:hypothetical protein
MKKTLMAALVGLSLFMTGCRDSYEVANPPLKKGWVAEKRFIPATKLPLQQSMPQLGVGHSILVNTPDIYVIVLGTSENMVNGAKLNKYSFYSVSAILFSEIEQGKEVDVTGNDGFKLLDVN